VAHCVSQWGESFRPAYLEIRSIVENVAPPLVTAFTATAGAGILEKIDRYIFGPAGSHLVMGNPDRPNIAYAALGCVAMDLAVRDLLLANALPAIVFCSSRIGTERLSHYLRSNLKAAGVPWHREVRFYHAGLDRGEKDDIEKWFMGAKNAVLCATCAYGMGVDKADIRTVIHRDCPPSIEAYLQESGRAGRDGLQAGAFLLWGPASASRFADAGTAESERFRSLLDYARTADRCRRQELLRLLDYPGEATRSEDPCCDVCSGRASGELRERRSITDFFRRNRNRYRTAEAAGIMAAGEGVRWTEDEAKQVIGHFVGAGILVRSGNVFRKGAIRVGR